MAFMLSQNHQSENVWKKGKCDGFQIMNVLAHHVIWTLSFSYINVESNLNGEVTWHIFFSTEVSLIVAYRMD